MIGLIDNPQMSQMSADKERDAEIYEVIGAAMAVHSELGYGFLCGVFKRSVFNLRPSATSADNKR